MQQSIKLPEKIFRDFGTAANWIKEGNPTGYEIQSIHLGTSLSTGKSYCEITYVLKHEETFQREDPPSH